MFLQIKYPVARSGTFPDTIHIPLAFLSSGRIDFHLPVPPGAIIELEAEVEALGASSLVIHCVIRREQIGREGQQEVAAGRFTFVAVDEAMRPVEIP